MFISIHWTIHMKKYFLVICERRLQGMPGTSVGARWCQCAYQPDQAQQ